MVDPFGPYDPQNDKHRKLMHRIREDMGPATRKTVYHQDPDLFDLTPGRLYRLVGGEDRAMLLRSYYSTFHPVTRETIHLGGVMRVKTYCTGCHKERWRLALVGMPAHEKYQYWLIGCLDCDMFFWKRLEHWQAREAYQQKMAQANYREMIDEWNRRIRGERLS